MIDEVTIDFGASTLSGWTHYEMVSDILTPADGWSLQLPLSGTMAERQALKERVRSESGLRCFLYVQRNDSSGRALQCSGIVDDIGNGGGIDGAVLHIRGRDVGGLLCDASADPSLGIGESGSFLDVVRAVCNPFGIDVVTESFASRALLTGERVGGDRDRLMTRAARATGIPRAEATSHLIRSGVAGPPPAGATPSQASARARARTGHAAGLDGRDIEALSITDAKPSPGETCWEFIDRHCRRFGAMPWISADGKLIISSPHYDQEPLYSLTRYLGRDGRNVIVGGGSDESFAEQSSSATVYGRGPARDATRSRFRGYAERNSSLMPLYRPLVVHDPSVRSEEEAIRRAKRELAEQNVQAFALEYEVYGHGQGAYLWAVDTVAEVVDEQIGVEGLYWVAARTFRCTREHGRTTKLRLLPVGALTL